MPTPSSWLVMYPYFANQSRMPWPRQQSMYVCEPTLMSLMGTGGNTATATATEDEGPIVRSWLQLRPAMVAARAAWRIPAQEGKVDVAMPDCPLPFPVAWNNISTACLNLSPATVPNALTHA